MRQNRVAMRQNRVLLITLILIGAAALTIFFTILLTRSGTDGNELLKEAGKAALQVLTVAVLGTVLKLLVDHYRDEQEQRAQDARHEQERLARAARFRQDKYDRLVEATNALRRVPILIDADMSAATFDEQLRQVVEAGLKLRMIKHQIWSSKGIPEPPFADHRQLRYLFESLYHYTDWLIEEFVGAKKESLLDAQRGAEDADLAPDGRERAAEQVRLWVPALSAVDDMHPRNDKGREAHKRCRKWVEDDLDCAVRSEGDLPEPVAPWSWLRYEETEGLALEMITRATLEHRRNDRENGPKASSSGNDG
jgi:hypothetical protein